MKVLLSQLEVPLAGDEEEPAPADVSFRAANQQFSIEPSSSRRSIDAGVAQ
jgi:hypothetical protein